MRKLEIYKKLTLLLSLFFILTATIHSTVAYMVTKTPPVKNTFKPMVVAADILVEIPVHKTVINQGTASIGPENFTFELTNIVDGEKLSVKSDTEGNAAFTLGFSDEDIGKMFNYTLSEVNDSRSNVTYSEEIYYIGVSVQLETDGKPVATVSVNGETVSDFVAEFTNIYDGTKPDDEPSPPTGDDLNLYMGIILALISGAIFISMTVKRTEKKA